VDVQARPLATKCIQALLTSAKCDPKQVEYTMMGWVAQDCRSPNIAKTAAEFAGVPFTSPGTTVHENCASGGAAIQALARMIRLGEVGIGIAGGVESMSNVPRYLFQGRTKNQLYGDFAIVDGLMGALTDTNVGKKGELMGFMTERVAEKYKVSRQQQDEIAFRSHKNALEAWEKGMFDYVTPIEVPFKKATKLIAKDEGPKKVTMEELAAQKPYFKPEGGTITGANSSSLNDGAATVLLASEEAAKSAGLTILAELKAYTNVGVQREYMGEGAFVVLPKLLNLAGVKMEDVDFFEINEAFAAVLGGAFNHFPALKVDRTNQWGSGISLGHPVGATGARQVVDMVHQLGKRGKRIGVTTRCVGGGIGSGEVVIRQ
jgi:acetyl-CoA C-acetyltransferase